MELILEAKELRQLQELRRIIDITLPTIDSFIDEDAEKLYRELKAIRQDLQKFISLHA